METARKFINTASTLPQHDAWVENDNYDNENTISTEINHECNISKKKLFLEQCFIEKKLIEAEKSGFTTLSAENLLVKIKEELRKHGDL